MPTPAAEPEPSWPDEPAALLRDVTLDEPLPWAIRAPYPWFCHMCDSQCHAGEIQIATVRAQPWRKPRILTQPIEWRHHLQARGDVDWRLVFHITSVLEQTLPPGTALRWNPATQGLDTITAPIDDWRDLRDQQQRRR